MDARIRSQVLAFLEQNYPALTPQEALAGPVAEEVFGLLPAYTGFALELIAMELQDISAHSERMQKDSKYAREVKSASKGEVSQILVKSLGNALELSRDVFTHPHEYDAIMKFAETKETGKI
jgi:hypothetical protein